MKKLTLSELRELGFADKWKKAVIVFKPESFSQEYSEQSRSYAVHSGDKYFTRSMLGNGLHGDCLDGSEHGVRLDAYMLADNPWLVDYCYITEQ